MKAANDICAPRSQPQKHSILLNKCVLGTQNTLWTKKEVSLRHVFITRIYYVWKLIYEWGQLISSPSTDTSRIDWEWGAETRCVDQTSHLSNLGNLPRAPLWDTCAPPTTTGHCTSDELWSLPLLLLCCPRLGRQHTLGMYIFIVPISYYLILSRHLNSGLVSSRVFWVPWILYLARSMEHHDVQRRWRWRHGPHGTNTTATMARRRWRG